MTIFAPGCESIPIELCVRQSHLKHATPYHAWQACKDDSSSPAQQLGTLVHRYVLEGGRDILVMPNASLNTLAGVQTHIEALYRHLMPLTPSPSLPVRMGDLRRLYNELYNELEPSLVASESDDREAQAIANAIQQHPTAGELLTDFALETEVQLVWIDAETGAYCQGTLDGLIRPGSSERFPDGLIVDLKTAQDASPERFAGIPDSFSRSAINRYGYHWQADHYSRGFEACFGSSPTYLIVAAETTDPSPDAVAVYEVPPWQRELARREYLERLRHFGHAFKSRRFPGYPSGIQTPPIPRWASKGDEQ
jgi:hypothetical protein